LLFGKTGWVRSATRFDKMRQHFETSGTAAKPRRGHYSPKAVVIHPPLPARSKPQHTIGRYDSSAWSNPPNGLAFWSIPLPPQLMPSSKRKSGICLFTICGQYPN
jgi:hypothetical protein